MSNKDIKQVEIVENYGSYNNVIFFNQTIYQSKTKKQNKEGYYYTWKTVVPRVIYDYLKVTEDIIYIVQDNSKVLLLSDPKDYLSDDVSVYKRKLNKKSHNFTVPKQLFDEDKSSDYVASFIFVPSESFVLVEFS
ncbi:MAG: hypothetical protein IJJ47_14035 [Methanosphaera sp.]|nr:hypothetical protein [Methanosphaera sp.]